MHAIQVSIINSAAGFSFAKSNQKPAFTQLNRAKGARILSPKNHWAKKSGFRSLFDAGQSNPVPTLAKIKICRPIGDALASGVFLCAGA